MSEHSSADLETAVARLREEVARLNGQLDRSLEIEQQFRLLSARRESHLLNTPLAVLFWDREFRIEEWNPAAEQIFGYTAEEAIGRHALDLIVPESDRAKVEEVVRPLLEQSFGTRSVNENITKDGRTIICQWHNTPVVDDAGTVVGVASLAQDITSQQHSNAMLRSVVENAPGVVLRVDRQGRIEFINRVTEDYTFEEVIGQRFDDFVLPEFHETMQAALEHVFATNSPKEYDVQDIRQRHWYHARMAPIIEDGQTRSVVVMALDVDEQRRQEQALRESQQTFEILANHVPGVVYLCHNDARYTMLHVSKYVEKLLGIPAEDFLENRVSFVERYHPEEGSSIPGLVDAAVALRSPFRLRYRLRHADGHWVQVEENGQGVYDNEGGLRYLVGVIFDNTAQRNAEEALTRSNAELEKIVNARTRELRTANRLLRADFKEQLQLVRDIRESEEKFRNMCDLNPGPVAITRASDGEILYANARLADVAGRPGEDMLGRFATEFYYKPSERDHLQTILAQRGRIRDHELQLRRANGTPFWASISMHPIQFDGENAVLTILLDIDERKKDAEHSKSKARMLRRILHVHDRDRELLGLELHDGFMQHLNGLSLFQQAAESKLDKDPAGARQDLVVATEVLNAAIEETRRLVNRLRPGVLEEHGLVVAIRSQCEQMESWYKIPVKCEIDVKFQRLAPAVETAIFRIVQEGLNNMVKHSQSKRAKVELSHREDDLVIKVIDWGVGFDLANANSKSYGLVGIRDRAKLLGGNVKIDTAPGKGTLIRVKLPLSGVTMPEDWDQPEAGSSEDSVTDWRQMS